MPKILEPAFSILCIFIVYKRITSVKRAKNKQMDDSLMLSFVTFFVTILLLEEDLYALLISIVVLIATVFVERVLNKLKSRGN